MVKPKCNRERKDFKESSVKLRLHNELKNNLNKWSPKTLVNNVSNPSPISTVYVNERPIEALLDSGATLSIMSPEAYQKIQEVCPLVTPAEAPILALIQPQAANGTPIGIQGITMADVSVDKTTVRKAYIMVGSQSRPPPAFIVGMNIIKHITNFSPSLGGKGRRTGGGSRGTQKKKKNNVKRCNKGR